MGAQRTICWGMMSAFAGLALAPGVARAGADEALGADETRAIVAEMLADAESRSSLLDGAGAGGHDGAFFLASPEGDFRLNISGQIQFRYELTLRDDDAGVDDFESGFEARRLKLRFDGHIGGPNLFYAVQGQFDRGGGAFRLDEDAYVGHRIDDRTSVRWGLLKLPFLRERIVSSKRQLAVDRSLTDQVFSQGDQSDGVEISRRGDRWRLYAALSDGLNSGRTDFTTNIVLPGQPSVVGAGEADYALTARVERRIAGEWARFDDFTSPPGATPLAVMVGGAAHWQDGAESPSSSDVELLSWTVDLSVEGDGWNAFAAYIGRTLAVDNPDSVGAGDDFNSTDHGFVVQGGFHLTERIEPFARYDVVLPDSGIGGAGAFNTVTAGLNYYLHGHAAKFTVDAQWFLDAADDTALVGGDIGSIGFLDNGSSGDEIVVRAQFQLLF